MRHLPERRSASAWRIAALAVALLLPACIPRVDAPLSSRPPPPERRHAPPPVEPADLPPPPSRGYSRRVPRTPVEQYRAPARQRPVWETRPVSADAREVTPSTQIVARGESLGRVSERTGASVEAIARANALRPPYVLRAGQRLSIPGGRYHLVRRGESGIAIARAYGVPWSRIVDANGLTDTFMLRVGQRVLIPDILARGSIAAERARAFTLDVDDILTGGEPAIAAEEAFTHPFARPDRILPPGTAVITPPALRGGFIWPAEGKLVKRFGRGASGERLDGVELAVATGSPVHAAADGVVAYAGEGIAALGGLLIVRHGQGWTTVYGHASKLLVSRGQSVKRGQTIALSGDTGFVDRPELHFELRKGRTPVDPVAELPRL